MSRVYGVIGQRHGNSGNRDNGYQSAEFDDYDYLAHILASHQDDMEKLVSGGARGLETLAERWANNQQLPFVKIKPALSIFTETVPEKVKAIEAAFMVRNTEIIDLVDRLVVFWNGSEHMVLAALSLAIKKKKEVIVYPLQ